MACSNNTNLTKLDDSSSLLPHHSICLLLLLMLFFRAAGKPKQAIFTHIAQNLLRWGIHKCDRRNMAQKSVDASRTHSHRHAVPYTDSRTLCSPIAVAIVVVVVHTVYSWSWRAVLTHYKAKQAVSKWVGAVCVEKRHIIRRESWNGQRRTTDECWTRKLLAPWCGFGRQCPAPD